MIKRQLLIFGVFSLLIINGSIAQNLQQDISDTSISAPKPYRYEDAGYKELDLSKLTTVKFKKGGGSEKLNSLIDKVSRKGGGIIEIPSGTYEFFQVIIKSNIHLRIAKNTTIKFPSNSSHLRGEKSFFMIGRLPNEARVENVSIIGEGTPENRPKFVLRQIDLMHRRVFSMGSIENLLIENFTIDDELTFGSAIAFNLQRNGNSNAHRVKNATVANVSMTGADQGYGLIQTNVGGEYFT